VIVIVSVFLIISLSSLLLFLLLSLLLFLKNYFNCILHKHVNTWLPDYCTWNKWWWTSTNILWIRNCSAYSEPMTSYALSELAGSRRTLLHMQQWAAGGRHGQTNLPISSPCYLKRRRSLGIFWRASSAQQEQEQQDRWRYEVSFCADSQKRN